jgi:hypothetical protein
MKYPIGLTFDMPRKSTVRTVTIVDYHITRNTAQDIVKLRYVVEFEMMGQRVRDADVLETTIDRALAGHTVKQPA